MPASRLVRLRERCPPTRRESEPHLIVGLAGNIREAHRFIVYNYVDNDEIYLFGSRRFHRSPTVLHFPRCPAGSSTSLMSLVFASQRSSKRGRDGAGL
jgi:hypothetical protein